MRVDGIFWLMERLKREKQNPLNKNMSQRMKTIIFPPDFIIIGDVTISETLQVKQMPV